jgi:hypothetical protein
MIIISGIVTIDKETTEGPKPRVIFFHQGDEIGHNLRWRHWRPVQLYFGLLPTLLRYAGMTVTEEQVSEPTILGTWDQFAVCQCGCAPTIVLEREGEHDLYVTIAINAREVTELEVPPLSSE